MTDDLIDRLATGLRPVRRSGMAGGMIIGLILFQIAIAIAAGKVRSDLIVDGGSLIFAWRIVGSATVAVICVALALRLRNPGVSLGNWPGAVIFALIAFAGAGWALDLMTPGTASFVARLRPARGLDCVLTVVGQAIPTLLLMSWLLRRGAIVRPQAAATATGLGAAGIGGLIWALGCTIDDPVYVVFWYLLTFAMMAMLARIGLPKLIQLRP